MTTLNNCPICFESQDQGSFITLSCGCASCSVCLTSWIVSQIAEPHYNTGKPLPCITASCKKGIELENIRLLLSQDLLVQIDNALLQVYLNKAKDIRRCPNQNCSYAGIIQAWSKCSENLKCSSCDTEWRDKQQYTSKGTLLFRYFQRETYQKSDTISEFWKWFFTKKCPGCKSSIEKNGGCSHMTCSSCQNYFCWTCLADPNRCNRNIHFYEETVKPGLMILFSLIMLIFLIVSLYKVPFIKTLADMTVIPAFNLMITGFIWIFSIIKEIVMWLFFTFWKLGVVLIFDVSLRALLLYKEARVVKALCVVTMVGCLGITYYFEAYKSVALIAAVETVGVSGVSTLYYIRKGKI